jgi:hypothetical protein
MILYDSLEKMVGSGSLGPPFLVKQLNHLSQATISIFMVCGKPGDTVFQPLKDWGYVNVLSFLQKFLSKFSVFQLSE